MNPMITGIGTYVPEKILSNSDLEKINNTSDEWIVQRTGIKERRVASGETTVKMARLAADDLMSRYGKDLADVDFIIFASLTPEHKMPSLASQLQCQLDLRNAGTVDITAACAGFVYGITLAQSLISSGFRRKILVVASEILTRHTDYSDRTTSILFGDGASVFLMEASVSGRGYKPVYGTEGDLGSALYLSDYIKTINSVPVKNNNKIVQDGKKVFKWAVERMSEKFEELLKINNLQSSDIDYFVPHSANLRIIEAICSNINIEKSKILHSLTRFGNTCSASIPLAIDLGIKEGRVKQGDRLLLLGFGGGLTYSGVVIDWII